MSFETPHHSAESEPSREAVVEALRSAPEAESTRALLVAWQEHLEAQALTIEHPREQARARLENDLSRAQAYAEAGFIDQALEDLRETYDAALEIQGCEDIVERIYAVGAALAGSAHTE